jgi:hypothetical protein
VLIKDFSTFNDTDENSIDLLRHKSKSFSRNLLGDLNSKQIAAFENICVYAIGPGNKYSASKIDRADGCGSSTASAYLAQGRNMSQFVEGIIYAVSADTDGDGIPDHLDQCPDTPQGKIVDANGCSLNNEQTVQNVLQ